MAEEKENPSVRETVAATKATVDALLREFREEREERRETCREHASAIAAVRDDLDKRVRSLESWRIYLTGAAALIVAAFAFVHEEIKAKLGIGVKP